jgi:glycosyltransferase involved in cell wall biosynthesis
VTTKDLPRIAVAVSTFNRSSSLATLIAALEAQTLAFDRFEVVIVDDGSSSDTARVLERAVRLSPLDLNVIRFDRNLGPAVGRNAAWRASTASLVAFTDDDCAPTPRWLEEGARTLVERPCVLVGATEPDPEQRHLIDPLSRTMQVTHATFAPTCNVFYLRTDLEGVGGFDETFRVPIGEDTDLAWRVSRMMGRDLVFTPRALVYHDVRRRTFAQAVKETSRWAGIAPVVARHKAQARQAWHRKYFLRPSHPDALIALTALIAAPAFPPAILLVLPWVRKRMFYGRPSRRWLTDWRFLPAVFVLDLLEIAVLARASLKNRTFIL